VNWDEFLEYAEVSDIGMRRMSNQDAHTSVLASDMDAWRRHGHLFVVADGMGAHAAGELASEMSVAGIAHRYHKYHDLSPPEALHKALVDTNAEIHDRGQANLDFHNMGTTTSALLLVPQGAILAHVGDSRVYRLRGNTLEQLTFDHSLVWELRASGQVDEDSELARTVPKNIITRSLGPNATVHPDFEGPFPVELGDTFLLCSDGLTGPVTDAEIGPVLATLPPREAARVLVDLANLRGGPDNITAVVVRVIGDQLTTRKAAVEPLKLERPVPLKRAHPEWWISAAVCFAFAAVAAVMGYVATSLCGVLGGVAALSLLVWKRWASLPQEITLGESRRLGKGPYVRLECPVNADFLSGLSSLVQQLRSATDGADWAVDLERFDRLCQSADQAAASGQNDLALRQYAHAITHMMSELREQSRRGGKFDLPNS
jgi:serine/threonine protein phosphatase PrpC